MAQTFWKSLWRVTTKARATRQHADGGDTIAVTLAAMTGILKSFISHVVVEPACQCSATSDFVPTIWRGRRRA